MSPEPIQQPKIQQPPIQQSCSKQQWSQIQAYVEAVRQANQGVNLVSRKDIDNLLEHHVSPCLTYTWLARITPGQQVMDIGSGGGFPGIINAILFPTTEFVLVESTRKKVDFLQSVITQLALPNVQAIWSRVEDLPIQTYGAKFDIVTCRGVATLTRLLEWATPYIKPGGTLEALKGLDAETEVSQLNTQLTAQLNTQFNKPAMNTPIEILTLPDAMQTNERLHNLRLVIVHC